MKNEESESSAWSNGTRAIAASGLVVAFLFASCGKTPVTHYYTLQVPPPPAASDPKTHFVLGVERFRASQHLRDDRLIYYQSPNQLGFYQQHRWSSDPATMLAGLVQRLLEQTHVFAQVRPAPLREPGDYVLNGQVWSFEEVDYEGSVKARVGLGLTLLRSRDRQIVWSAQRQMENAVQEPGMAGVANAFNAAVKQVLDEMIPGIIAQVENDFRASKEGTTP